jgi:hypothetical protein
VRVSVLGKHFIYAYGLVCVIQKDAANSLLEDERRRDGNFGKGATCYDRISISEQERVGTNYYLEQPCIASARAMYVKYFAYFVYFNFELTISAKAQLGQKVFEAVLANGFIVDGDEKAEEDLPFLRQKPLCHDCWIEFSTHLFFKCGHRSMCSNCHGVAVMSPLPLEGRPPGTRIKCPQCGLAHLIEMVAEVLD